jgi:YVTN family beta-propeller protein
MCTKSEDILGRLCKSAARLSFAAIFATALTYGAQAAAKVYVTNSTEGSVSVIDVGSGAVWNTIVVGRANAAGPQGIVAAQDGHFVYVARALPSSVVVIDTSTDKVVKAIDVPGGAQSLAISPDGTRIYVGAINAGISVIDTVGAKIVASIDAGNYGHVAISPDGSRLYATSYKNGLIVIDTASNTVTARAMLQGGFVTNGLAVAPDGKRVYVALVDPARGPAIYVFDTTTGRFTPDRLPIGDYPKSVRVSRDGMHVFGLSTRSITKIDLSPLRVQTLPVPGGDGAAFSPDETQVYAPGGSGVAVINLTSPGMVTIPVGAGASDAAFVRPSALMRTVSGVIGSNGAPAFASGDGFTVIHTGDGQYVIKFNPEFGGAPAIVASQTNLGDMDQNTNDNVVFPFVDKGSATALTGDYHGNHVDRGFSFLARGPE